VTIALPIFNEAAGWAFVFRPAENGQPAAKMRESASKYVLEIDT
jgi:hypothetical protein